jgi:FixJ family two-component response regulator
MPRTLFLLDDDTDLRETISELFDRHLGCRTLALGSFEEMTRSEAQVLATSTAILDINLGAGVPSGVTAYQWLREKGYRGAVVFLSGHGRTHPLVAKALELGAARVAEKPIGLSELEALVAPGVRD